MATRKIGPAVAAGCTMILKPATETPLTAMYIVDVMERAGLPKGVLNLVLPERTGAAISKMLHDPRVKNLSFTGSTEVGRVLLKEAADKVIRCSMELGGNAQVIVHDDADLAVTIPQLLLATSLGHRFPRRRLFGLLPQWLDESRGSACNRK